MPTCNTWDFRYFQECIDSSLPHSFTASTIFLVVLRPILLLCSGMLVTAPIIALYSIEIETDSHSMPNWHKPSSACQTRNRKRNWRQQLLTTTGCQVFSVCTSRLTCGLPGPFVQPQGATKKLCYSLHQRAIELSKSNTTAILFCKREHPLPG